MAFRRYGLANIPSVDSVELERQAGIMQRIYELNTALSSPPLAFVDTYGCQQNEADSEKIRGMLHEMGYGFTDDEYEADLIVINTCAIREHAEMRILGNVGALVHTKRKNPEQKIVLCGCMVQQEHMIERIKKSFHQVDLVFGTHELYRFPELMDRMLSTHKGRIFEVRKIDGERVEGLPVLRQDSVKAWLSVMYGCTNFCSYCIVPYVRGRERSRAPEAIFDEARQLIDSGYKEITLLGQNVNSYGRDLGGDTDFSYLLSEINKIPGDFIIRFMTSHPKDATDRLFQTMADCEKVENHIHLPFQSGNDRLLKAMNRNYTKQSYLELVEKARSLMPDISITSDVIVGFPGETDEEFEDTLDLVRKVRFDMLFTFIYSPREGTPAAKMPDPFTREEKQRRFDRLIALHNEIVAEKQAAHVGKVARVLIDGESRKDSRGYNLTSRTSEGRLVLLKGSKELIGQFRNVLITDSTTWSLCGEIC
jgi:tRNA-2-methylthio-N6-dimethylallyladenosine synthase